MTRKCRICPNKIDGHGTKKYCSPACYLQGRQARFKTRTSEEGSLGWARNKIYHTRTRARRKGVDHTLTPEDYIRIASTHTCVYCKVKRGLFTLDRIDNNIGYIPSNVVYCCWVCNVFRSVLFTPEEMKILGPALREVRGMRGHYESDYYLLGLGNTIRNAGMTHSSLLPKPLRVEFAPRKIGRPRKKPRTVSGLK